MKGKVVGEMTVVWFRDDSTEEKKGGSRTAGGRGEDVELLFGRDTDGEDQGRLLQRDRRCCMLEIWR